MTPFPATVDMGSLSRFRDGVDHLFVAALVASGVRRAGIDRCDPHRMPTGFPASGERPSIIAELRKLSRTRGNRPAARLDSSSRLQIPPRTGIEPEPGSGEVRFVGEPARGEQRHGQTDRFAVLCRRAVTASRRRRACRETTAH